MSELLKLLAVDDEPDVLHLIRAELGRQGGFEIETCTDGHTALAKVVEFCPDLVLLDMKMSAGTEGIDALKAIGRAQPQLPIIMMSGWGDIPKAVEAIRAGALDFLEKGRDFDELLPVAVSRALRQARLERDRAAHIRSVWRQGG